MVGFPITYGDNLTVEESSKRIKSASKVCIEGFIQGFKTGMLVYGTSKLLSRPAFAADGPDNAGGAVDPATPQKLVKVSDAQCGSLAASCGAICTIAGMGIANSK